MAPNERVQQDPDPDFPNIWGKGRPEACSDLQNQFACCAIGLSGFSSALTPL